MKREMLLGIAVLSLGSALVACRQKEKAADAAVPPAADTLARLAPSIRAQLDTANAAYSAQKYDMARKYYLKVTELDPTLSAGWFGVYMAESKLGNEAAADAAIARARKEGGS